MYVEPIEQPITKERISQLIKQHISSTEYSKWIKYQEYYEAKTAILDRSFTDDTKPNNKIVHSYASYITDINIGYFMGNPISFTVEDENYKDILKEIFKNNDIVSLNTRIEKQCSIKGKAYELLFIEDDEDQATVDLKEVKIDPEEMIVVYTDDLIPKMKYAIRFKCYNSTLNQNVMNVELYTKEKTVTYRKTDEKWEVLDEVENLIGEVPIVEYINNEEHQGDFEKVITMIDEYDKTRSNTANDNDYFNDAYLVLENYDGLASEGDEQEEGSTTETMKQTRIILLEENGKAYFLTKTVNDAALENNNQRLNKDIHKFSYTPDLSDDNVANQTSGIALQYKMFGLEEIAVIKENNFRESLSRRLMIITKYINLVYNTSYSYTDIEMQFTRNMPQNLVELADMISKLGGLVSKSTRLSMLPFIDDPKEEMEKIKQEEFDEFEITTNEGITDDDEEVIEEVEDNETNE